MHAHSKIISMKIQFLFATCLGAILFQMPASVQGMQPLPNEKCTKESKKPASLHDAVGSGKLWKVELALNDPNIDVNATNGQGITALHLAAQRGYTEIVQRLLEDPRIDVNAPWREQENSIGTTPLTLAAEWNRQEVARLLIAHPSINPNAQGDDGHTPLHWAVGRNNLQIVEILIAHPATNINAINDRGKTPLDLLLQMPPTTPNWKAIFTALHTRGACSTQERTPDYWRTIFSLLVAFKIHSHKL